MNRRKKLQERYYDVKQQVKEAKQKWIDEDKEKRRIEKEQKKQELDKYYDDKRKKREERDAEEEKQVPMEDELEISNRLIQLLESFLPAQPVKQDDPSAPKEPVAKGRGAKKPKGNDINYQWQDYAAFERVSLTPPIKRELIPKAIEDLKAKRVHYKNMQEEFKKTQATKKTAQEEAAKKAVEEKTTQKSLVNTENPALAVSTSTVTVTEEKPATTPAPSTEHNATEKPQEAAQA